MIKAIRNQRCSPVQQPIIPAKPIREVVSNITVKILFIFLILIISFLWFFLLEEVF